MKDGEGAEDTLVVLKNVSALELMMYSWEGWGLSGNPLSAMHFGLLVSPLVSLGAISERPLPFSTVMGKQVGFTPNDCKSTVLIAIVFTPSFIISFPRMGFD